MDLLKKIKIELWVLFLAGLLSLLLAISIGTLVRQELVGSIKLGVISKAALFLAEIPMNLKSIVQGQSSDLSTPEQRFPNVSGFQGEPLEEETYLLLSRYDGDAGRSVVELVDLRSFEVKKTWRPDIDQINELVDTSQPEFENLERDANASRYRITHSFLTEDGGLIFLGGHTPLVKIDKNSQLVWQNQEDVFHHSIEQDHEGNFWVPSHLYPYQIDQKYVGLEFGNYYDDAITKISADGEILFQKSVSQIFIDNDMESRLSMVGTSHEFQLDPIHINDIQPVNFDSKYWKKGDVFISLGHQSMLILFRPSTEEILWKYDKNIFHQHDVNIINKEEISIFNNNRKYFYNKDIVDGHNEVLIYNFETQQVSSYLQKSLVKEDVRTISEGRGEILSNSDLFIEEENYGRTLYFNADGSLRWTHVNRADNGGVYIVNWSRILYKPEDIKKVRKILEIEN